MSGRRVREHARVPRARVAQACVIEVWAVCVSRCLVCGVYQCGVCRGGRVQHVESSTSGVACLVPRCRAPCSECASCVCARVECRARARAARCGTHASGDVLEGPHVLRAAGATAAAVLYVLCGVPGCRPRGHLFKCPALLLFLHPPGLPLAAYSTPSRPRRPLTNLKLKAKKLKLNG